MTVRLPGGSVEHIRYSGNVPPRVIIREAPDVFDAGFGPVLADPAFADLERISAEMNQFWMSFDRRMAAAVRADDGLLAAVQNPDQPIGVRFGNIPAGSYASVSEFSTNGVCTNIIRIIARPGQTKPEVVSRTSGDCGKATGGDAVHVAPPAPENRAIPVSLRAAAHIRVPAQTL